MNQWADMQTGMLCINLGDGQILERPLANHGDDQELRNLYAKHKIMNQANDHQGGAARYQAQQNAASQAFAEMMRSRGMA